MKKAFLTLAIVFTALQSIPSAQAFYYPNGNYMRSMNTVNAMPMYGANNIYYRHHHCRHPHRW